MKLNICSPYLRSCYVYVDGELVKDVVEVDSEAGIVKFLVFKDGQWKSEVVFGDVDILEEPLEDESD